MHTIAFIIATALATLSGFASGASARQETIATTTTNPPHGTEPEERCSLYIQADAQNELLSVDDVWFVGCGGIY